MRVIINSDDFGLDDVVNNAILTAFGEGIISSTTLLVNKQGFEDAVNKVGANSILKNRVGLHINLTDGKPLTDGIKKCDRFCNNDCMFTYNRSKPYWRLTNEEKPAVYSEIKAQIDKSISHGIVPTHFDSHHHAHTEWGIIPVVIALAKEYNINKIRLSRNTGTGNSLFKRTYRNSLNFFIRRINDIKTADHFGNIQDILSTPVSKGVVEIMVHAMYNSAGMLVDNDNNILSKRIKLITAPYELIGYANL